MDYDSIIPQNQDRTLFNEILVNFTDLVGMIGSKNSYDICYRIFYPMAKGRSFSGPKVKIEPRSNTGKYKLLTTCLLDMEGSSKMILPMQNLERAC